MQLLMKRYVFTGSGVFCASLNPNAMAGLWSPERQPPHRLSRGQGRSKMGNNARQSTLTRWHLQPRHQRTRPETAWPACVYPVSWDGSDYCLMLGVSFPVRSPVVRVALHNVVCVIILFRFRRGRAHDPAALVVLYECVLCLQIVIRLICSQYCT